MKNLKLLIAFTVLASCYTLYSCDDNPFSSCNQEYYFIGDNEFTFNILDKRTKEDLLAYGQIGYNYDTVKVYYDNWEVAYNGPVRGDGRITLRFLKQEDVGVIDQLISRRFYMYFNHHDIDTIDFAFETKKNKCKEQIMKSLKVSYNDSIYLEGPIEKYYVDFLK
jgi:hypothetical protein